MIKFIFFLPIFFVGCSFAPKDLNWVGLENYPSLICTTTSIVVSNNKNMTDLYAKSRPLTIFLTTQENKQWLQVSIKLKNNFNILGQALFVSKFGVENDYQHYLFKSTDNKLQVAVFVDGKHAWIHDNLGQVHETVYFAECNH